MAEIAPLIRRPIRVDTEATYREIGIRSFAKGVFHKPPTTGLEIGDKRVFSIKPGDLLFNIVFAWEGAVAIATDAEEGTIGSHRFLTCLTNPEIADPYFLFWWFARGEGREQLLRASPGGAGRNRTLGVDKLAAIQVPLPTLVEQRRIVAYIASIGSKIAEARRLRQEANDEMHALFASQSRLIFADAERGKHCPIEAIALVRGGIQKSPDRAPGSNPVRYLTVAHVHRNRIVTGDPRFFEVTSEELDRWRLMAGDVLIIEGNGSADEIGRCALFRGEIDNCVHQNHVIRIRPEASHIDPEFLNLYLNGPIGREEVQARSRTTSGLRSLSVGRIRSLKIPVPELAEQRRIVEEINAFQTQIHAVNCIQTEVTDELGAVLPIVIDQAFRG